MNLIAIESEFERFTRGRPINDEMAALRDDPNFVAKAMAVVGAVAQVEYAAPVPVEDVDRELERSEKLALKELRMSPGWPVLERLLEKAVHAHRKYVISMSEHDPLANRDLIANQWAYLNSLKAAKNSVIMRVNSIVQALDEEAKR